MSIKKMVTMENLFERILRIVAIFEDSSQTAFAKKIGCQQSTFNGYMKESGQAKIRLTLLEDILRVYTQIDRNWLYFGEGDMLGASHRPLHAENAKGQLTGDLLGVALDYYDISNDDVVRRTNISMDELHAALDSRTLPSFRMLEQLHQAFGINPAYFFHSNQHFMRKPQTALERAAFVLGHESRYDPSYHDIQEWFGVSKVDAKEYLSRYREGRKNEYTFGLAKCIENELPTEPVIPESWIQHFESHVRFSGGWLHTPEPPMLEALDSSKKPEAPEEANAIKRENSLMRELLTSKEEVIALQKQLLAQGTAVSAVSPTPQSCALGMDNVARA